MNFLLILGQVASALVLLYGAWLVIGAPWARKRTPPPARSRTVSPQSKPRLDRAA